MSVLDQRAHYPWGRALENKSLFIYGARINYGKYGTEKEEEDFSDWCAWAAVTN